ncbi:MAG TPA: hypothetical protein VFH51_20670 [Myxococcota bacterium]|nr:hypothetical protein [Myxococcota bacterium]
MAREAGKKVVNETAHAALVACANDIDSAFDEARLHAKNPPLPRAIQGAEDALEHAITPDEGGRGTGEKIDKKRKNLETVARRYGVSIGGAGKLTPPRAVWVGAAVGAGAWLV